MAACASLAAFTPPCAPVVTIPVNRLPYFSIHLFAGRCTVPGVGRAGKGRGSVGGVRTQRVGQLPDGLVFKRVSIIQPAAGSVNSVEYLGYDCFEFNSLEWLCNNS